MFKNSASPEDIEQFNSSEKEYDKLLRHIHELADHKLGYPVSLLSYLSIIDNQVLGIKPNSLANVLLNNVGDPFIDSQTSLMEVKKHERKLIRILEKYYGLRRDEARGYVTTGGTEGNFASLWWSKRYLVSRALSQLIATDDRIKLLAKNEQDLLAALVKTPMNDYKQRAIMLQKILELKNAMTGDKNIVQQILTPTVFFAKDATHYSVPKVSEILRMNIRPILANPDGSINITNFRKELMLHLGAYPNSSIIVIANIGTTITGAIDDVPQIKKILEESEPKITYTIHMDGALTGFVLPILKPFGDIENYFDALGVNTLVFSAHKYPGLSQPCGIILAKKDFLDKAFEKNERNIEYVGNIRDVTISGSRSGLNVLMFYNALYALGLRNNIDKLKEMLLENLHNAEYLYKELVKIFGAEKVFYPHHFNVLFPKPSMALAKKYQLMLTGERATICVLTNVTKHLIDEFILDLRTERENNMKKELTEYTIKTLDQEHLKSAVDLFTKAFCDSEPMTKYLMISYEDYIPFATDVLKKAVKDGLSKVALDSKNNVVGLILSEDLADAFKPNFSAYPKLKPVYSLLEQLSQPYLENKEFKKGKVIHTWIAATDPHFRSKGLSVELVMAHAETALRKGYEFIYADFTNEISEKITRQFKVLRLCNTLPYDDFEFEGRRPLKGLKGRAACYIATLNPATSLESLEKNYTIKDKASMSH